MSFLSEIVAEIREDVSKADYFDGLPLQRSPSPASLVAAVRGVHPPALIIEYKRESPGSRSPTLPQRSVAAFVSTLEGDGPTAYSCLASRPQFHGSPRDVFELARRTRRPVLFKDLIVDSPQLEAAQRAGASAVLLIARLETEGLLNRSLTGLATEAHLRGLEVLLELHDPRELSLCRRVSAELLGVNVRDLATLRLDANLARETLRGLPPGIPSVAMSGIDVESAPTWANLGVSALLIGTAAARAPDLADYVHQLSAAVI